MSLAVDLPLALLGVGEPQAPAAILGRREPSLEAELELGLDVLEVVVLGEGLEQRLVGPAVHVVGVTREQQVVGLIQSHVGLAGIGQEAPGRIDQRRRHGLRPRRRCLGARGAGASAAATVGAGPVVLARCLTLPAARAASPTARSKQASRADSPGIDRHSAPGTAAAAPAKGSGRDDEARSRARPAAAACARPHRLSCVMRAPSMVTPAIRPRLEST